MGDQLEKKSSSDNSCISKYHRSFRDHSSERDLSNYSQNSLQFYIILINEPNNPGKHLLKLQEIIRNKKLKMSNEEIKNVLIGFQDYYGLLKFGLVNSFECNRITALEILVDLLLPERNILFDRYAKFL